MRDTRGTSAASPITRSVRPAVHARSRVCVSPSDTDAWNCFLASSSVVGVCMIIIRELIFSSPLALNAARSADSSRCCVSVCSAFAFRPRKKPELEEEPTTAGGDTAESPWLRFRSGVCISVAVLVSGASVGGWSSLLLLLLVVESSAFGLVGVAWGAPCARPRNAENRSPSDGLRRGRGVEADIAEPTGADRSAGRRRGEASRKRTNSPTAQRRQEHNKEQS